MTTRMNDNKTDTTIKAKMTMKKNRQQKEPTPPPPRLRTPSATQTPSTPPQAQPYGKIDQATLEELQLDQSLVTEKGA
jgi:hypothetical protein